MTDVVSSSSSWHTYPSIYALGHRAVAEIFNEDAVIEEKIDGSQFSFGVFPDDESVPGGIRCRSKGAVINVDAPDKMFRRAVEVVVSLAGILKPGWTYRAEYLQRPKHNVLAYDRTPVNNLIIFDINTDNETYLSWYEKEAEAERLGLEVVPLIYCGRDVDRARINSFLERTSVLGGQKIEGVVVKNYMRYGIDKKVLMAKFVSEAFKETHNKEWRKGNPTNTDFMQHLGDTYATPARWQKALQHLREAGCITDSPRDIGVLIREVWPDIVKECRDEILEALWDWASPQLQRMSTRGLPEWYKTRLLDLQFTNSTAEKEPDNV